MFRRRRMLSELESDIREHIARETEDNIARGLAPEEARRRAFLKFGNPAQIKEDTRSVWTFVWLEQLMQDIRFAARMLRKSPGFTAVAILTLALGIGATTGIFSVVDAALIRSLPFREPARLVALFQAPEKMKGLIGWAADGPDILDWQRESRSFSQVAASLMDAANITGGSVPQHVNGQKVTANYFDLLGVQAAIGRTFSGGDETSAQSAVVLSYSLWRASFGGQNILGRTIALDGKPFTVIGIMPAVYHDPRTWGNPRSEYWILLPQSQLAQHRGEHMYASFARLAAGVTLAQAQQELNLIAARDAKAFPNTNDKMGALASPLGQVNLQTFEEGDFRSIEPAILLLQLAAGFLLLIACANVANLMLSHSLARYREFAVRLAIGAGRMRIIRQLLTESILLSLLSGAAGVVLAFWCVKVLLALAPKGYLPPTANIGIDTQVLAFTVVVAALTGILAGLLPAVRASRRNLNDDLKAAASASGHSPSRLRAQRFAVILELAATFILLAGGGLMVRSLASLLDVNPGFNPRNFFTAGMSLPAEQYAKPEQIQRFFLAVQQRVAALPGIDAVSFGSAPEFDVTNSSNVIIENRSTPSDGTREIYPQICYVTPNFYRAAGIPILEGRDFNFSDVTTDAKVAIVSHAFAEHFWPRQDALGKRLHFGGSKDWLQVIGIVGDVHQEGLAAASLPEVYFPLTRELADGQNAMNILARSSLPPALLAREISDQVSAVDAGIPLSEARTGSQILEDWSGYMRYRATLLASFAAMALLIAAIGLFGTISYATAQRTHELGLRMALGAQRGDLFRLIILQGAKLVSIGLLIGIVAGLSLARGMATLVYGITPFDPLTFIGVAILLALVALAACYVPASRAMKVDPMVALRYE